MFRNLVRVRRELLRYRHIPIIAVQLCLVILSNYIAFWLRFDGQVPPREGMLWLDMLPWLVLVRGLVFVPCRLYTGLWRYSGLWDLRNIILGVSLSTIGFYALLRHGFGIDSYPRSIFLVDSLVLIFFLGGMRMSRRLYNAVPGFSRRKRVLIYGAGDTGEMIVRDMKTHTSLYNYRPVGFIDDDPSKIGDRIHGVRVLGTRSKLQDIVARTKPQEVIITIPSADRRIVHEFVKSLERHNIAVKTVPNLREINDGRVSLSQMRSLTSL
jgi:FlaA1/EpsC-like NDP-sugar epimerase